MNSLRDKVAVVTDTTYVIWGRAGTPARSASIPCYRRARRCALWGVTWSGCTVSCAKARKRSRPTSAMRLRSPKPSAVRARHT